MNNLEKVKELLKEEIRDMKNKKRIKLFKDDLTIDPILHNKDMIILQMWGWSINLLEDGTWFWEDTSGG